MIQVELEVAAVGWARRQIPPDIILKKKNLGAFAFAPTFLPTTKKTSVLQF